MINLEGFLRSQIVYQVNSKNVMKFLTIIETQTHLKWRSGDRPTEFIPPEGYIEYLQRIEDDMSVLMSVDRSNYSEPCLEYIMNSHYIDYDEKPIWIFQ